MAYEFTEHAREALEKRGILPAWVTRVAEAPEAIDPDPADPDLEHRLARISEWGNRVLRVIVNGTTRPPRIVTAFFDRRRTLP